MQDIRVNVNDGSEFLADEVSISHSPIRFILDFKNLTPRLDVGENAPRMVLRHNVIVVDPYFAKDLLNVLKENIDKYEKKYGQIKRPEVLAKAEKQAQKEGKKGKEKAFKKQQDYFG